MLLALCVTAVALLLGAWGWFQWTHRALLSAARGVPVLYRALPIIGHSHYTLFGIENVTRWVMDMSMEAMSKGVYTLCFWCGPLPLILIHDRKDIQKILNSSSTFEKAHEYKYFHFAAGEGLLTAPGDVWKITRRHISPLFQQGNIDQMMSVFNRNTLELEHTLAAQSGGASVNLIDHTVNIALKTICQLIFGTDVEFNVESKSFKGLAYVVKRIPEVLIERIVLVWLRSDTIFNFFYKKELSDLNYRWKLFTEETLKIKRSNEKSMNTGELINEKCQDVLNDENFTESNNNGELNLLDVYGKLQENYSMFTENELKCEMMTLYATGSDTVGVTVAYFLLILAYHQEIQERLYREILSVVEQNDDITREDLNRMPYLDQVYKETLRWSTIVPFIARRTTDEIKLSSCTVPAGHSIVLCLEGVHMDPQVYHNPRVFDPERFSTENLTERDRNTFVPFSGGPRNCIGKVYAELLTKVVVVRLLRRFKLTTETDIYKLRRKLSVLLVSAEGYNVSLHKRNDL